MIDWRATPASSRPRGHGLADLREEQLGELLCRYTDAVERDKLLGVERPDILIRRAALFSAAGEHERAKRDAQEAVRFVPTMAVAHFRVGVAEFELENYEAAVRAFAEGLKASPGSCDLRSAGRGARGAARAAGAARGAPRGPEAARARGQRDGDAEDQQADGREGCRAPHQGEVAEQPAGFAGIVEAIFEVT